MSAINGFINLYKPLDWTSHDCVAKLRRLLNTKKVGHGGTLDPKATGVLPVAVGRATKLLQYLPADKSYRAVFRFGVTTTTDDLEGEIVTQRSAAKLTLEAIEEVLPQFLGEIAQTPPIYSAIQVDGKRLYQLARQGKSIEVPSRQVTVHKLESQHWQPGEQPELTIGIDCGAGTYIRSLARDLGEAVGAGATLAGLVRTRSSGFELADSLTIEDLEQKLQENNFEPVAAEKAMRHLSAIALPRDLARRWRMGQKLVISDRMQGIGAIAWTSPSAPLRILDGQTQAFLGIGTVETGEPTVPMPNHRNNEPNTTNILTCRRVYLPCEGSSARTEAESKA